MLTFLMLIRVPCFPIRNRKVPMCCFRLKCVSIRGLPLMLAGIVVASLATGCDFFSGPTEYEQMKMKDSEFSDLAKSIGGTAEKKGQALGSMQSAGWQINLSGCQINEEVLTEISKLGEKEYVFELNLSNSSITDEQLLKLNENLVGRATFKLNLADTAITDSALDNLNNFHCLIEVNLKRSKVTKDAVKRLRERRKADKDMPDEVQKMPFNVHI